MAEKKFKLTIKSADMETNPNGVGIYRMILKTDKREYEKAILVSDWDDPKKQKDIKRRWVQEISKIESRAILTEDQINTKLKKIKGREITEDE